MTIEFACRKCGRKIRVRDEAAGQKGKCQDCGSAITVPSPQLSHAPAADQVAGPARLTELPPRLPANKRPKLDVPVKGPVKGEVQAQANAVASDGNPLTMGKTRQRNRWALAAFVLAILSLLISWIPTISIVAIVGVSVAVWLTVIGFVLSFRPGRDGRLMSIAAGCVAGAAVVSIVICTAAATAAKEAAASAKALADAMQAHPIQIQFPPFAAPKSAPKPNPKPAAKPSADASEAASAVAGVTTQEPAAPEETAEPDDTPPIDPPKRVRSRAAVPTKERSEAAARRRFSGLLRLGQRLAKTGNVRGAERNFRRIIDGAPNTSIAAEAQKELDALPAN